MTESYFHNFTRCLDKAYGVNNLGEQLQDLSERGKYQPAIVVMRTEPSARNDLIKTDGELDPDCDGCWYDRIDEERRSHAQREALINRFRDFQGPGERSP